MIVFGIGYLEVDSCKIYFIINNFVFHHLNYYIIKKNELKDFTSE